MNNDYNFYSLNLEIKAQTFLLELIIKLESDQVYCCIFSEKTSNLVNHLMDYIKQYRQEAGLLAKNNENV